MAQIRMFPVTRSVIPFAGDSLLSGAGCNGHNQSQLRRIRNQPRGRTPPSPGKLPIHDPLAYSAIRSSRICRAWEHLSFTCLESPKGPSVSQSSLEGISALCARPWQGSPTSADALLDHPAKTRLPSNGAGWALPGGMPDTPFALPPARYGRTVRGMPLKDMVRPFPDEASSRSRRSPALSFPKAAHGRLLWRTVHSGTKREAVSAFCRSALTVPCQSPLFSSCLIKQIHLNRCVPFCGNDVVCVCQGK